MSVAEILSLEPFREATLVAGAGGLDRRVEHVTVIEVPEPSRWSSKDALVVSTLYSCQNRDDQVDLVARLARSRAGGLAIHPAGPARAHYDDMARAAEREGFPIIRLHPEVPYLRIFEAIYGELLNRQATLLRASEAIYNRFTGLVVSGQDLRAVASALHEIVDNPVLVLDAQQSKRLAWGGPFDLAQQLARLVQAPQAAAFLSFCADSREPISMQEVPWPEGGGGYRAAVRLFVAPIRPGGELARYLVLAEMCKPIDEVGLSAIRHASTAVSLDVLRERAVLETERRMAAGLLDDLLSGDALPFEALILRGDALGMDLRDRRLALFVSLCGKASPSAQAGDPVVSGHRPRCTEALLHLTEAAVKHMDPSAIVAARADGIAVLPSFHLGQPASSALAKARHLAAGLVSTLRQRLGGASLQVGVGVMVDSPCSLRRSYETARWAVATSGRMGRETGVVEFDDLGFYQLAAGSFDGSMLDRFVSEALRALQHGSGLDQEELMRTLETFFDCRESFVATAEKLYVHPNTVKYRIEKIRKILPSEVLSDADRRLTLHLALKLRRIGF